MPPPLLSPSQISIYIMAAGHLAIEPPASLNDNSNQADTFNNFWDAAVREMLRAAPWDCNTGYVTLAQSSTYQIITNWGFAYQYPASCRVWKVMSPISGTSIVGTFPGIYPNTSVNSWNGFNMQRNKFQVRYDPINNAKVILTNASQAIAEYSVPLSDVSMYDDALVRAISLRLAAYACPSLVNDDTKTNALMQLAASSISEAMRQNDEEGSIEHNDENSSFLNARGGGGPVSPQFWNSPSTSQY